MKYYLSLGSNKGDRLNNIRRAYTELEKTGQISGRSNIYETEPFGLTEQDMFLNSVCILNSTLRPFRLLRKLKQIETRLGRVRNKRWAAREIDIDIIDWEGHPVDTDILAIPHKMMLKRRFVLQPLKDVAPGYRSRQGLLLNELIDALDDTDNIRAI